VDQSVRLEAGDREGIQHRIEYFPRCPFSQGPMIQVTSAREARKRWAALIKQVYETDPLCCPQSVVLKHRSGVAGDSLAPPTLLKRPSSFHLAKAHSCSMDSAGTRQSARNRSKRVEILKEALW
jgi:hypothetical protein